MTFDSWKPVVDAILNLTRPATSSQRKLARVVGGQLPKELPSVVAAAIIKTLAYRELDLPEIRPVSEELRSRVNELRGSGKPPIDPKSTIEAEAWIRYLRLSRRKDCLQALSLKSGDIVQTDAGDLAEVSSIGHEGRVYFKGGNGFSAWPDTVHLIAKTDDDSQKAAESRREAANAATLRRGHSIWSEAKHQDLKEFESCDDVSDDDMLELEDVLSSAADERPIQAFLGLKPHLLTALLGGRHRYCIPQPALGKEYVPDFIVGDVDSLGVKWVLVEIETPRSGIYLRDGRRLEKHARDGVAQVKDWREWLTNNLAYARQRRSENGLGLFDIRDTSDAIVLVGRRHLLPETKDSQRHDYRESNRIHIHTYDWLIERLQAIRSHSGPPASNDHLFRG